MTVFAASSGGIGVPAANADAARRNGVVAPAGTGTPDASTSGSATAGPARRCCWRRSSSQPRAGARRWCSRSTQSCRSLCRTPRRRTRRRRRSSRSTRGTTTLLRTGRPSRRTRRRAPPFAASGPWTTSTSSRGARARRFEFGSVRFCCFTLYRLVSEWSVAHLMTLRRKAMTLA